MNGRIREVENGLKPFRDLFNDFMTYKNENDERHQLNIVEYINRYSDDEAMFNIFEYAAKVYEDESEATK